MTSGSGSRSASTPTQDGLTNDASATVSSCGANDDPEPTSRDSEKRIVRSGWADVRLSRLALRSSRQWLVLSDVALFMYKDKETALHTWPLFAISDADIDFVGASTSPFGKYSLELGTRASGPSPPRKFFLSFKTANERDNWAKALALLHKSVLVLESSGSPDSPSRPPKETSPSSTLSPPSVSIEGIPERASLRRPSFIASSTTFDTTSIATNSSPRTSVSFSFSRRGRRRRTASEAPKRSTVSSFVSYANTSLTSLLTIASEASSKFQNERDGISKPHNGSKVSLFTLDFEKFQPTEELLHSAGDDGASVPENPLDLTGAVSKVSQWPIDGGGYADVWKGKWTVNGTSRPVAIKVVRTFAMESPLGASSQAKALAAMSSEKDAKISRRLQEELLIWHRLRHPHIITLWGTASGFGLYPSFVAPWMRNGNAREWMKGQDLEQTRAKRLKLLLEIALALEYIHNLTPPIIHGDLKACNVLINDVGEACLADFGLSSVLSEAAGISPASLSARIGSTRWLAFELVVPTHRNPATPSRPQSPQSRTTTKKHGKPISGLEPTSEELARARSRSETVDWNATPHCTTATDVWAFGSTAYELLSGRVPYYHRANDLQVLYEIMLLRRPQHQDTGIPLQLWSFMEQSCWAENPHDRPDMSAIVRTMGMFVEVYRLSSPWPAPRPASKRGALPPLPKSTQTTVSSSSSNERAKNIP